MTLKLNKKTILKSPSNFDYLIKATLLAMVENSVGTTLWRNFYVCLNGQQKDIMRDGDLSCAFFVSSILLVLSLIDKIHGTVDGVVFALEKSGWQKIKKPKPGAVLVWVERTGKDSQKHKHLGFYLGRNQAVSNNSKTRKIARHHYTFGTKSERTFRPIEAIYWHEKLN